MLRSATMKLPVGAPLASAKVLLSPAASIAAWQASTSAHQPRARSWGWQQQQQQRHGVSSAASGWQDRRADRYAFTRKPAAAGQRPPAGLLPPPQQALQPGSNPPALAPVHPSVLESRTWLLRLVPLQQFRAVGVSFDGRQALIPQLHKGQALAFVREPDNPHDPHAVSIQTLDGQGLGYIARDKTGQFLQDLCFGIVGSLGQQGEQGLWGLTVLVQPTIPPVEVYAFPANLRQHVSLGMQLSPAGSEAWAALKAATLAAAQGRCAVTGAPLVAVHERWAFDDERRVLRLLGFRAEAPEVQQIGSLLELDACTAEGLAALLQRLNCWAPEDMQLYLQHQQALRQQRSMGQWHLDLGLMGAFGIPVPPALQPLCI